jgi:hypothetical protein
MINPDIGPNVDEILTKFTYNYSEKLRIFSQYSFLKKEKMNMTQMVI